MCDQIFFAISNEKSKERYAARSITRISRKVQWTGHRSTIMIRALHMQYQIVAVNRIRWRRVLFHADGTNEKKWRSRWRQMIRGTRLDLLKVTETNQQNESNVSTERVSSQHVKFINAPTTISFRYNRCFFVHFIPLLLSPIVASIIDNKNFDNQSIPKFVV